MRADHRVILAALALCSAAALKPLRAADLVNDADEQVLRAARVGGAGPDLLVFFRKRTLSKEDLARIAPLVKQLGDVSFKQRKQAIKELTQLGPPALAELRRIVKEYDALKRVLTDTELEARNRATECVEAIAKNPGPALPLAALHVLEARKPVGCCSVLLAYLPFSDNKEVEEEAMEALVSLGKSNGKVDPALTAALKDPLPLRRAAAAYALGRMGDMELRPAVRALLADGVASVRQWTAYGLVGKEVYRTAAEAGKADRSLFTTHKLPHDEHGLLEFFRKRTLSDADQARLRELVADLGSKVFRKRDRASRALAAAGSPALHLLRGAIASPDVEIASRARRCLTLIEEGPGKGLALAGTRQILLIAPAQALETLLAYVPFCDDDEVEEQVYNTLCVFAVRDVAIDAMIAKTLDDPKPARRAAAAHVLGRVGTARDATPVRKLLADVYPKVRLQAAQAMLAARQKTAVPVLVDLLCEGSFEQALAAEDMLGGLTGDRPTSGDLTADKAIRQKAHDAWATWWRVHEAKIDLAGVVQDTPLARAAKARKVCSTTLEALIHFNVAAFKKNLRFPFYMEGLMPNANSQIMGPEQIDQFFKMLDMIPQIKDELKRMTFKLTRVGRLDEYLEHAPAREKNFLVKLRKPEIYVVYLSVARRGVEQPGGGGAMFVRLTGGRAWLVGVGNPGRGRMKK